MENTKISKTKVAKFKRVKTLVDLQNDPRVDSVWNEDNSWWCLLVDGYEWAPNSQQIHETTIKSVCSVMNHEVKAVEKDTFTFPLSDGELKRLEKLLVNAPINEQVEQVQRKFEREDNKYSWTWDFKVNGFNFWIDAVKDLDGLWEFATYYDGEKINQCWNTKKWYAWENRNEMVQRFFDNLQTQES